MIFCPTTNIVDRLKPTNVSLALFALVCLHTRFHVIVSSILTIISLSKVSKVLEKLVFPAVVVFGEVFQSDSKLNYKEATLSRVFNDLLVAFYVLLILVTPLYLRSY